MEAELLVRAILVGLAAWRGASLLVAEDGPFEVFRHIRRVLGMETPGPAPSGLRGLLQGIWGCMWCMTVWTAAGAWLVWEVSPEAVTIMAAMAIAVLAHHHTDE